MLALLCLLWIPQVLAEPSFVEVPRTHAAVERMVVRASERGILTTNAPEQNTRAMLALRDELVNSDRPADLILPPGTLRFTNSRWLKGIRDIRVFGGPTHLQNTLGGSSTTERIPLWINPDLLLDDAGSPPGFGKFVTGVLIQSVAAGQNSVIVGAPPSDAQRMFKPGSWVLVYGYNQASAGFPPSIRHFEYHRVRSVAGASITLDQPLENSYRDDWRDIDNSGNGPTGRARLLSLQRSGFRVAEYVELNDLVFEPSPGLPSGNRVSSLSGSLYASGVLNFVGNRLTVNGFFYPTTGGVNRLNDSFVQFTEIDKLLEAAVFDGCTIGELSNGPATKLLIVRRSKLLAPVKALTAAHVLFEDVQFFTKGSAVHQIVNLSASTPQEHVRFIRPALVFGARGERAASIPLPLISGGGHVDVAVSRVLGRGRVATPFTGLGDPVVRGLTEGSVLRSPDGRPVLRVTAIYALEGETVIEGQPDGAPISAGDRLHANHVQELEVVGPVSTDMGSHDATPLVVHLSVDRAGLPGAGPR